MNKWNGRERGNSSQHLSSSSSSSSSSLLPACTVRLVVVVVAVSLMMDESPKSVVRGERRKVDGRPYVFRLAVLVPHIIIIITARHSTARHCVDALAFLFYSFLARDDYTKCTLEDGWRKGGGVWWARAVSVSECIEWVTMDDAANNSSSSSLLLVDVSPFSLLLALGSAFMCSLEHESVKVHHLLVRRRPSSSSVVVRRRLWESVFAPPPTAAAAGPWRMVLSIAFLVLYFVLCPLNIYQMARPGPAPFVSSERIELTWLGNK